MCLATAAAITTAASTAISAGGTIAAGNAQRGAEDYAARQAAAAGKAALAEGSASAANEARTTQFALSRAQAGAAAAGADTTSPTVVSDESQLAGTGEYNVLSALFTGQSKQNLYNQQAETDIFQGKQDKTASDVGAATTIAKGGASMLELYGNAFSNTPNTPAGIPSDAQSWNTGAGPLPWLAQNRLPWQTG